ncbi:MAG TPA: Ni/Fe-hydrogenase cytochrome b subunit [Vicinamibacteria bacterium]|nr:Ni/Fe-hydrogenase cytochrome b subunit [Vicinamibacteria bacterium]
MRETATLPAPAPAREWVREKLLLGLDLGDYVRSLKTGGNALAFLIVVSGLAVIAYRFAKGLGSVTNLSQTTPWGLWVGLDVLCGVALAAGGYTLAAAVYIFGLEQYRPVVRPAVLTGFLGYLFAVFGLLVDLGQPWRLPYPLFYKHGVSSVMFEVGWCVFLYLIVLFLEFAPALFEWLGLRGLRRRAAEITIGLTVFGVVLSTLHQSSLGALFLMAPGRLHPLWYSPFIPIFFFVSSIAAGLSMVIIESALSHRIFRDQADPERGVDLDAITLGLGRGAAVVLFSSFFLRLQGLAEGGHWAQLRTGYGLLFLIELVGFVLLPSFLFARAARRGDVSSVRLVAVLAVLGVVLNRLNVSLVAFDWNRPARYVPSGLEVLVSLTIITLGILSFRFIVNRMPILRPHPQFASDGYTQRLTSERGGSPPLHSGDRVHLGHRG